MRVFRPLLTVISILSLTGLSTAAIANEDIRWYDTEIIVFENISVPRSNNTHWEVQAWVPESERGVWLSEDAPAFGLEQLDDEAELPAQNDIPLEPRLLPESELQLLSEAATIRQSSRYKLLVHTAWRQAGMARADAIPVRIRVGDPSPVYIGTGGSDDSGILSTAPNDVSSTKPAAEIESGLPDATLLPDIAALPALENFLPAYTYPYNTGFAEHEEAFVYPLDGTITVALGRYLHVYTDLALTRQSPALQSFVMQSHRRMRSRRLHYIDHPHLGILVIITPFEPTVES